MAKHKITSPQEAKTVKKTKVSSSESELKQKNPNFQKPTSTKEAKQNANKFNGKQTNQAEKPEDWNEFKKQKKELRLKRRQNKSGFDTITKAKKLGEKLRCKNLKGGEEERNKLINELHLMLKGQGHYAKYVLAHDTSRLIQWLLKYSSDIVKTQISHEIIPVTIDMLQSKYGIFCIKRLLKYGNHDTRSTIIDKFYGHAVKLSTHSVSAPVFEYAYSTWASAQQKQHLIQEFFGELYKNHKDNNIKHLKDIFTQSPDLKAATLTATKGNLSKILDKNLLDSGLVQTVINQYLGECSEADRADLISQLAPHIVVISNSKDGARAAMQCIWFGSNKDRKTIMKTIKEHTVELSKHEHGHCTIITLFDAADDTVLLQKIILSEILNSLKELAENEWGRRVLLWLVAPGESTSFHPTFVKELEEGRKRSTSKKDIDVRRKEILEYSIKDLLNSIMKEPEFWLKNSSLAYEMLAILKAAKGDELTEALQNLVKVVVDENWKIKVNDQEVLGIEDAGLHMVLKKLAKHDQTIEDVKSRFGSWVIQSITSETLNSWIVLNRGCFLLVAIYENSSIELQEDLKVKLKDCKKLLKAQSSAGSKILLKKLNTK